MDVNSVVLRYVILFVLIFWFWLCVGCLFVLLLFVVFCVWLMLFVGWFGVVCLMITCCVFPGYLFCCLALLFAFMLLFWLVFLLFLVFWFSCSLCCWFWITVCCCFWFVLVMCFDFSGLLFYFRFCLVSLFGVVAYRCWLCCFDFPMF